MHVLFSRELIRTAPFMIANQQVLNHHPSSHSCGWRYIPLSSSSPKHHPCCSLCRDYLRQKQRQFGEFPPRQPRRNKVGRQAAAAAAAAAKAKASPKSHSDRSDDDDADPSMETTSSMPSHNDEAGQALCAFEDRPPALQNFSMQEQHNSRQQHPDLSGTPIGWTKSAPGSAEAIQSRQQYGNALYGWTTASMIAVAETASPSSAWIRGPNGALLAKSVDGSSGNDNTRMLPLGSSSSLMMLQQQQQDQPHLWYHPSSTVRFQQQAPELMSNRSIPPTNDLNCHVPVAVLSPRVDWLAPEPHLKRQKYSPPLPESVLNQPHYQVWPQLQQQQQRDQSNHPTGAARLIMQQGSLNPSISVHPTTYPRHGCDRELVVEATSAQLECFMEAIRPFSRELPCKVAMSALQEVWDEPRLSTGKRLVSTLDDIYLHCHVIILLI